MLGPQLVTAPDEDTLGVVAGARPLAEGVLAHLTAVVAVQPDAVVTLFAMGLDDITGRFPGLVPDDLQGGLAGRPRAGQAPAGPRA